MPSFKLGSGIKDALRREASRLSTLRVATMTHRFPLEVDEIQAAIMPPEPLKQIRWLTKQTETGISTAQRIHLMLKPENHPGLDRHAAICLYMPVGVYPVRNNGYLDTGSQKDRDAALTFHEGELTEEARDKVTEWATKAIKERRLEKLSVTVTAHKIAHFQSSGDILAKWPFIATLVPDYETLWRERLRNGPRSLKRYGTEYPPVYKRLMEAAELFLTSAQMLDAYVHPANTVRSELVSWEKLPNDRF
jgi:hypothetical protein